MFGYSPRPGHAQAMEEGYRRHLDWHKKADDSLPWYGWTVVQGHRLGLFIDGTFGITFEEFEARPDPGGDLADAQKVFLPHVEPRFRQILRYRADLSGSSTLEERAPSPLVQAIWVDLDGADLGPFESALSSAKVQRWTVAVYERLSGGPRPGYLILLPMDSLADFPETGPDPLTRVLKALSSGQRNGPRLTVETELWRYRPSLSLVPEAPLQ